jgi:kynureninase
VRRYVDAQLETWASYGVSGHFQHPENSPLPNWQDVAEQCAKQSAHIVGASPDEIVIMNTLTVNLHILLASFYRPTETRHEIILEWKPFPSDYVSSPSTLLCLIVAHSCFYFSMPSNLTSNGTASTPPIPWWRSSQTTPTTSPPRAC